METAKSNDIVETENIDDIVTKIINRAKEYAE